MILSCNIYTYFILLYYVYIYIWIDYRFNLLFMYATNCLYYMICM